MAVTRLHRLMVVCATCVLFAGCVSGKTYRTQLRPPQDCVVVTGESCAHDAFHTIGDTPPNVPPVLLGFVEFDDQGYLRQPELKRDLLERIRATAHQRPILIVVFAHGWKHNASASDGNVIAFEDLLTRLAKADATMCAGLFCEGRQTIGIYLGWRGLSNRVEPFKEMTFWARKARAERVGSDGAVEVLAELAKISAIRHDPECSAANRLIVTGHSFGAALIYEAVRQQLVRDSAYPIGGRIYRNAADLVVLVNPAFEAARLQVLQRRTKDDVTFAPGQHPILAVFTSVGDTATKRAFPFGRALGTLGSEYTTPEQERQDRTAVGHYAPYQTHALTASTMPESDIRSEAQAYEQFAAGERDDWTAGGVTLTRLASPGAGSTRFTPYVVASVETGLIGNHNDIWGSGFTRFLYRYVAVQSWSDDLRGCRPHQAPGTAPDTEGQRAE